MGVKLGGHEKPDPKIVAVCGKGGVGKTSISALMIRNLMARRQDCILAIDADPAEGLATSLGIQVKKSVDDIRNDLITHIQTGQSTDPRDLLSRLDYDLLNALVENRNLAFLAIGRPEKEGCYCQINQLLKEIIAGLSQHFDYVIIDGEAGVEQVNRRVMTAVTHLVLVSDLSLKGIKVCATLRRVAAAAIRFQMSGLIINRVRPSDQSHLPRIDDHLNLIGTIPESEGLRRFDQQGRNLLCLQDDALFDAVRDCMNRVKLLT